MVAKLEADIARGLDWVAAKRRTLAATLAATAALQLDQVTPDSTTSAELGVAPPQLVPAPGARNSRYDYAGVAIAVNAWVRERGGAPFRINQLIEAWPAMAWCRGTRTTASACASTW